MRDRGWLGPAIVALAVAAAGVLAHVVLYTSAFLVDGAFQAAAGAVFLCVAALAALRYHRTDDPRRLVISVGSAAAGVSLFAFRALWTLLPDRSSRFSVASANTSNLMLSEMLTLAGWTAAAIAFLWATPWVDRRGRRPVEPRRVILPMVLGLGIADTLLISSPPSVRLIETAGAAVLRPDPLVDVLSIAAAALLATQAVREWRHEGRTHAIAGASFACGAFATAAFFIVNLQDGPGGLGETPFGWARYLPVVSAALLFAAELADSRTELSRMRRDSDRAAEITGGRAEIASMVAHEIRGPVTTIKGLAQTSERHYDRLPEADRREFLRLIETESERLLRIADQTSTALKVDAGTLRYELEPNDLADVVTAAVGRAATGEHPVSTDLEPGIGVAIDSVRFGEAVREVVENAAAFSPPDSPVAVRAYRSGTTAVVEVVDRGPGIPPERRELAFAKFPGFRPAGYEEVPGTGLGLFITRAHVLEQGGTIVIDDGPDGGTMLRISLPVREG